MGRRFHLPIQQLPCPRTPLPRGRPFPPLLVSHQLSNYFFNPTLNHSKALIP
ncbi:hypothetical protein SBA4_4480001 [Candidatus Sulfopaludibacter sp. SbA4]|nr:hypothetical protein SBA4_4480001 [Candidatus Sulfopaludibacter sp. SbA4]